MGSRPPSRITAPGTKPRRPTATLCRRRATTLAACAALLGVSLLASGCSEPEAATALPAVACDRLRPGTTYSVDLDDDGVAETLRVDGGRLTIRDGDAVYRSRDEWRIVDCSLGNVDGDGFLEVVALVDDQEGRHIGLWAYFGGEYRERIVTSELSNTPATLEVVNAQRPGSSGYAPPAKAPGDVVVLFDASNGAAGPQPGFYRWNGFGFMQIPIGDLVTEP